MKLIKQLFVSLVLLCATQVFAAPELGRDYKLVQPAQPTRSGNKVEVLEFFFYGCSHCFHLHPLLSAWEKSKPADVEMVYVPTIFNSASEPMAYTFYALELMGKQKQLDDALYNAWNSSITDLSDEAKIAEFVGQHGVDSQAFKDNYQSFSVQSKVMRSKQMTLSYHISGTPTLVVDGKYLITGLQPEATVKALSEVVEMARKEHRH